MRFLLKLFLITLSLVVVLAAAGAGGAAYILYRYGRDLQDYKQLADYEPAMMTRVHAGDGHLIAEYATERRVFVPVAAMPRRVVNAFVAAEDQNFYTHVGVDPVALTRAVIMNVLYYWQGRRLVGASTITQQVAKNFLLTNEVSIERKIKEAILAFRIERALPKDRILELYLNEIYLGYGSYGVAAAALNYFDKSLDELTTAEAAYLAALPKAPNNYHPVRKSRAAKARRDWVIGRMLEEGYVDRDTAELAKHSALRVIPRTATEFVEADYFVEEVRRELADRFGEDQLYEGGLSVRTTLDSRLQGFAEQTLRQGLITYDRRHGWRGPLTNIAVDHGWFGPLRGVKRPLGVDEWPLAVVLGVDEVGVDIGVADGVVGRLPFEELTWAREPRENRRLGPKITHPGDVLEIGDVVLVEPVSKASDADAKGPAAPPDPSAEARYGLRQIPGIEGAIVVLDPHTGRVLAMNGGFHFARSEFNRATQALRQPGSAFKPFVYLAGLDKGYTPGTLILDAPFVLDQGPGKRKWKPANYSKKFYGASPMRIGIEKSRNLMTVRLARAIGMETISEYAGRFDIMQNMPLQLSMSLGAGETALLRLTAAYAMLVNGGKRVTPTFIDRIQDRNGKTVFRHDARLCEGCVVDEWRNDPAPHVPDLRETVTSPASAYQIVSMLKGVVQRGTGRRIRAVGKPLAGKTGTTNREMDTWFIGFSPDLAVGVFAGFDTPKPLGRRETGSSVAAPIFRDFMALALKDKPSIPFRIPPSVRLVRVEVATGRAARPGDKQVILEAYKIGAARSEAVLIDGSDEPDGGGLAAPTTQLGGKY
jgi:penicillin-binding protein 1A